MKYYAVTDDPMELYHYGVKGMKWGQHIFGDKPKSPGYHKAVKKLKSIMGKTAKAAKNTTAQISYNHRARQENKYQKAVQKAQRRISQIEGLNFVDQQKRIADSLEQDRRDSRKAYKAQQKVDRKYSRNEKKMQKFTQEAREGRLRYGQLSEDQVKRIGERLAIERSVRSLGNTEKPKFKVRLKEATQEGILRGTTAGITAAMEEVARAKIQNKMENKKILDIKAKQEGERQKIKNRAQNKKTHKEVREDLEDELYKAQVENGVSWLNRGPGSTVAKTGKKLQEIRRLEEQKKIDSSIKNDLYKADRMANSKEGKRLQELRDAERERQRIQTVQDRLSNERDEAFEKKFLDDYGYKSEEETKESYKKYLEGEIQAQLKNNGSSIRDAKKSAGYKAAKQRLDDFNNADENAQRRIMLRDANANEKRIAIQAFTAIKNVQEENKKIDNENKRLMDAYSNEMKEWSHKNPGSRGKKPRKPTLKKRKKLPTFDARTYRSIASISNLPQLYGGGGNKNN